jgi:hypothetical protein
MNRSNLGVLLAALAALALSSAACSGGGGDDDDDDGGFSDDGGSGTQTLRITAALSVGPTGDFLANVNVLTSQSTVVSGATVTLRTPDGDLALVEQPVGFGTYVLPAGDHEYAAGFGLEIDAGADGNATGIGFDAPGLTEVLAPLDQTTLPVNQDINVTWAGRGADQHRFELTVNDYDSGYVEGDTGSDVILAAVVTSAATETLTIRRRKELDITSGFAGSKFTANLEDVIEPLGLQ